MNRALTILLATIYFVCPSVAQTKQYYYDKHWLLTTKKQEYVYKRVAESVGDSTYEITDYYHDGKKQMTGTYVTKYPQYLGDDRSTLYRHDTFTWYNTDGEITSKGKFIRGYRHGEWLFYYTSNQSIAEKQYYDNGKPVGTWKEYDIKGALLETSEYDSVRHGTTVYYQNGQLYRTCIYKNGKLVACTPPEVVDNQPSGNEKMPEPGYDINKFLTKEIKYPKAASRSKIQGKAFIKFVVNAEGYIVNIEPASHGVHELLMLEAIRVVQLMPRWQPGYQNGKPVNVYYTLPINFKL